MNSDEKCPTCGSKEIAIKKGHHHFIESGLNNVHLINVDVLTCNDCREEIISIPRSVELMKSIGEGIVLKPTGLTGAEIRFLRKNLLIKINEFAQLLGVDQVTVSRWENEHEKPGRSADRLVRLTYAVEANIAEKAIDQLRRNLRKEEIDSPVDSNDFRKRKLGITRSLREQLNTVLSRAPGEYVFVMKSGPTINVDSFRKNAWSTALKNAGIPYRVPYSTRHTFAAWSLTLGTNPNKNVRLMGHSSKKMVYEVDETNCVEGLEKRIGEILEYFGNDFGNFGRREPLLSRWRPAKVVGSVLRSHGFAKQKTGGGGGSGTRVRKHST